jgi:hypothetical protein
MPFGGLLTAGLIGAGGSIISGIFGSSAATKAAQAQVAQEQKALDFQEQEYSDQKANQAPFIQAGQSSLATLMADLSNGTFGAGSLGPAPVFNAPTLQDARNTPGYQFTQEQGEQGIERGAAAAGGAVTGGTLKALTAYDSNLADTTYNQIFNNALSSYGAALNTYSATANAQQQEFNQIAAPISVGESAAANAGATGAQAATTIGNTLGSIGQSQASGIIGSTNAITNAISGVTGAVGGAANQNAQNNFLAQLFQSQGQGGYTGPNNYGTGTPTLMYQGAPYVAPSATPSTFDPSFEEFG